MYICRNFIKMKYFITIIFIYLDFLAKAQTAYDIFKNSRQKIEAAKNISYYNASKERINGVLHTEKSYIKLQRSPFLFYMKQLKEGGAEILFNPILNKKKTYVNPGTFPFINIYLSPFGKIMRENAHHTIFQADIKYTYDVINTTLVRNKEKTIFKYIGKVSIENKIYYKLSLINTNYKIVNHIVKKGETILSIAQKNLLCEYKILELNPNISFYNENIEGEKIKIPTFYAKSIYIYISTKTDLPYLLKVSDEKGIFEIITFKDLKINQVFKKNEFLPNNKDYNY